MGKICSFCNRKLHQGQRPLYMRFVLLAFFTMAQPTSTTLVNSSSPQTVLLNYFRCFQLKTISEADTCAKKYISALLPKKEQDRLRTWPLAYHFKLAKVSSCSRKLLMASNYYPLSTETLLCGTLKISAHNEDAIFFFNKDSKGSTFLYSIFY
jgi:hypothetical protein